MTNKIELPDDVLNELLARASKPKLQPGFEARFADRLARDGGADIIAFPSKFAKPQGKASPWFFGVPVAASLFLGVFMGAQGVTLNSVSQSVGIIATDELADLDVAIPTGFEEAELAAEEDLT